MVDMSPINPVGKEDHTIICVKFSVFGLFWYYMTASGDTFYISSTTMTPILMQMRNVMVYRWKPMIIDKRKAM